MIDYYRARVAELEHTIICHQDRFRLKDERIAMLEQLARDLWQDFCYCHIYTHKEVQARKQRMDALGILEVDE